MTEETEGTFVYEGPERRITPSQGAVVTAETKGTLGYYLRMVVTVSMIMASIWATMILPAMREIANDRVQKSEAKTTAAQNEAQAKNEMERLRIEHRTEMALQEIKDTLKSIDQRLWDGKKSP